MEGNQVFRNIPSLFVIFTIIYTVGVEGTLLRVERDVNNCFDVKLTTKWWANEIKWKIGTCKSSRAYKGFKVFTKQCCLPPGNHKLTCKDDWGDGWNGGFLEIHGQRYCENFNSDKHEEDITIGAPPILVPPVMSGECQTNEDCNNNPNVQSNECKAGFKNMTTECECLPEMWCRDNPSNVNEHCQLLCYPKKVAGCAHWGDNCKVCQETRGADSCKYKEVIGQCQEDGKCDYPDNKCRTNIDCGFAQYCTWHDIHVSGSCDPGYYSPNDCPLGECRAYQTNECYSTNECGPNKFCTEDDCQDQCPPGKCLPCDPYDPTVMEEGFTEQNLSYYCDNLPVSSPNDGDM